VIRLPRSGPLACITLAFLLAACGGQEGEDAADTPPAAAQISPELERAAASLVAFLQGRQPLDTALLADTVTLYVSPEGGGGYTRYRRGDLLEPDAWQAGIGERSYPLVPPPGSRTLTTKVGRHLNCREFDLASRNAELADFPHVGTKLEPAGAQSCLQSWNLTFVFDSEDDPRLIAAVYDQWEW
jgi:hypothetical protein